MSNDPNQQTSQALEAQQVEQARKEVNRIAEEIAQLSEADLQPAQYYSEFLQRVYFAIGASVICIDAQTGAPAPDFCLQGIDGQNHCLKDYAASKVLVVAFTSWATGARVIRSQASTLRTREFVTSTFDLN